MILKQTSKEHNKSQILGFTLVEMLVVMAIVTLMLSVAILSFNSVRVRARNAKRKADINHFIKALELYRASNNSLYPVRTSATNFSNAAFTGMMALYINDMPVDPMCPSQATACNYRYISNAAGTAYGIHMRFSLDGGTDCKHISPGGTATWFGAGVARCTY